MDNSFMDKLRCFLGIRQDAPRNDFRNPIWGGDDDDDGDELYSRDHMDVLPSDLHDEFARQMHDMFQSFGSIFGDMRTFFHDFDGHVDSFTNTPPALAPPEPDNFDSNRIRDFYLKPGYHNHKQSKQDVDLDGKVSSHEIAGLLKQKQEENDPSTPFNGNLVPGRSFCRTIITTSITKPDGTRKTKRIVKNGHEVVEETVTTMEPDAKALSSAMDSFPSTGIIYSNVFSELGSLFKNVY